METVKDWLKNNPSGSGYVYGSGDGAGYGSGYGDGDGSGSGYGDGSGDGAGYGSGYGDGDGSGSGSGSGFGFGAGYGYGFGSGSGDGSGYGSGYGYGFGSGYGDGAGYGYGDGDGIGSFDGQDVHRVDDIQTIIISTIRNTAQGFILNSDFTLTPCFIAKGNGYFAHGKTLREAVEALRAKIFESMDPEEAIEAFMEKFKKGERYKGTEFFEWHHYLTGSCLMGRETFVKNKGIDLNATYTVEEFIELCESDYGGEVIRELKERLREK